MDHEHFFEEWGDKTIAEVVKQHPYFDPITIEVTIEQMYQAFKSRLLAEVAVPQVAPLRPHLLIDTTKEDK
jgi:hypothetical protein